MEQDAGFPAPASRALIPTLITSAGKAPGAGWLVAALGSTAAGGSIRPGAGPDRVACNGEFFDVAASALRAADALRFAVNQDLRDVPAVTARIIIDGHLFSASHRGRVHQTISITIFITHHILFSSIVKHKRFPAGTDDRFLLLSTGPGTQLSSREKKLVKVIDERVQSAL